MTKFGRDKEMLRLFICVKIILRIGDVGFGEGRE
jgi:hypothetical protein